MAKKKRVKIHDEVASELLYVNDHACCLCRDPNKPVQIHHIDGDPSNNDPGNLAVVCVECQNKIHRKGGVEKSYLPSEVKRYKILWERAVANKRKYLGIPPIIKITKEFDTKTGVERVIEEKIPYANGLASEAINITPPVSLSREKELIMEKVKRIISSQSGSEKLLSVLGEIKQTREIRIDDMVILSRICLSIGDSKFHAADYGLAEIFYREALNYARSAKESEIVAICLYELGASVGVQGRNNEALRYFDNVIRIEPDNSAAWFNKSLALFFLHKNNQAISACLKAIEFGKKASDWGAVASAYYNMGNAQQKLEKYQDAIASYLKAIEVGRKASDWDTVVNAYSNMGNALDELEKYQDAIASYLKAIEFGEKADKWSTVAGAYSNMGNALDELEKYQDAIASYLKAIEFGEKADKWSTVASAYSNMGNALGKLKKYQDAIASYLKAIEFGEKADKWSTVAGAYYNTGNALGKLKRYQDAIASYLKAIEFGEKADKWSTVAGAYCNRGTALSELERCQDAIDSYLKAIEFGKKASDWSTVASTYYNMGNAQRKLEKYQDAIASYLKAIESREFLPDKGARIFPTTTRLICFLGMKSIQENNHDQAKEFAERLAHIYVDGAKDGIAKLIAGTIGAFELKLSKEDMKAFQEFRRLCEKSKSE